jgi:NTE family protein
MNKKVYINDINDILDHEINSMLNKKIDNIKDTLVLSGGSFKGIAQLGALHCLKKNNMLGNIRHIACTSVGAIIGFLYCSGYQPLELFKILKLIDIKKTSNVDAANIVSKYGLDDGKRIVLVIKKLINAKGYQPDITFKEFYTKTSFNLIVTGSCVNDKKAYYFSHTNFPDMKVLEAVRISMSVPIIFTPCIYEGNIFVDGACIDNFPIRLFNDRLNKVIGIHVSEKRKYVAKIKFIEEYLNNTIQCIFEGNMHGETKGYEKQTIMINCAYTSETINDFISMFEDGYTCAQKKLDTGDLS